MPVISKGRYDQATRDVEIDETARWRSVHLRTLRTVLVHAPYRDALLDLVEPIYAREDVHLLVDLNVALLRALADRSASRPGWSWPRGSTSPAARPR